jgi:diguanylate cyclase (GGDEF)-like protein
MMPQFDSLSVLAIDDNPTDLVLLRRALERLPDWQVSFHGVTSLEQAKQMLDENRNINVVFMDYRLGAVDGVEAIRHLRSLGLSVPVVLLTGQGNERVAALSRRQGASDYLCKDDLKSNALRDCLLYVMSEYRKQRRNSRALKEALVDGLTGLVVKEYLHRRAGEEVSRARRYGTALSCIMLDLDHFKLVNDEHGHLAGDAVLRRCAQVARVSLRETDIAGRFGGEEMCLILPQCTLDGAVVIAERIRTEIEKLRIIHGKDVLRVTVSAGVSVLDSETNSADALIDAADKAMYEAKRTGRNRVCAAASVVHPPALPGELDAPARGTAKV